MVFEEGINTGLNNHFTENNFGDRSQNISNAKNVTINYFITNNYGLVAALLGFLLKNVGKFCISGYHYFCKHK